MPRAHPECGAVFVLAIVAVDILPIGPYQFNSQSLRGSRGGTIMRTLAPVLLMVLAMTKAGGDCAYAQSVEPFASIELQIDSDCPFACDSFQLVFSGEYTSSNWQTPVLDRVDFLANGMVVYLIINYNGAVGLPVITPFEKRISRGPLPVGRYIVLYSLRFQSEPTPLPNRSYRDTLIVGAPGDINCDRSTDISDVVTAVNQTFRGAPAPDPPERGDLTCDSHRNILDVLQAIDYVFRAGSVCGPCQLYTPPLVMTDIPPESLTVDSFSVWGVQLDGDSLRVQYAYGDNCLTHHFAMFMSPSTFEDPAPRIAHIYPVYHDHNDNCEALVVRWISVGLEGLVRAYESAYPGDPGPMILRVHHHNSPVFEDVVYNLN